MKIFISWSKKDSASYVIAQNLKASISNIFPDPDKVSVWISDDILAGTRPIEVINKNLTDSDVGIVCVTLENIRAPWLNFEAGAISVRGKENIVVPMLIDLKLEDIANHPLSQFQCKVFDLNGFRDLIKDINSMCDNPLSDIILNYAVEGEWRNRLKMVIDGLVNISKPAIKSIDDIILKSRKPLYDNLCDVEKSIFISGTTLVIIHTTGIILEKLKQGVSVRLLMLENSKSTLTDASFFYDVDISTLESQLNSACSIIRSYKNKGYNLEVRTMGFVPSIAFIATDIAENQGVILAQHYFFQTPNDQSTVLRLTTQEDIYTKYRNQLERMWEGSSPLMLT